jgi:hypothetical protein
MMSGMLDYVLAYVFSNHSSEFMMLNHRILTGLVCSSLGLGVALPAVAQQVVLTPGGTAFRAIPQLPTVTATQSTFVMPGTEGAKPAVPDADFVMPGTEGAKPAVPDADFVMPGVDKDFKPKEYIFVPAPGTGVDGTAKLEPGRDYTTVTIIATPSDPDPLIGGPGGTRYSDLVKSNNPDQSGPFYTSEKFLELVRRGEIAYTLQSASSTSSSSVSSVAPNSVVTSSNNEQIAKLQSLNLLQLPSTLKSNDSPLDGSRILPGFNQ